MSINFLVGVRKRIPHVLARKTKNVFGLCFCFITLVGGGVFAADTTLTMFPADAVPSTTDWSDNAADPTSDYELGTLFTPNADGQITAIRYYKSPTEPLTAAHTGHIWSAAGTELATVTFATETADGWQEATLSTPLQVSKGSQYTVSTNITLYYCITENIFAAPSDSVIVDSICEPYIFDGETLFTTCTYIYAQNDTSQTVSGYIIPLAGVFNTAQGAFPTETWHGSNYYRDVVFTCDAGSVGIVRPQSKHSEVNSFSVSRSGTNDLIVRLPVTSRYSMQCISSTGRIVAQSAGIPSGSVTISHTKLSPGIFFVRVSTQQGNWTTKSVVYLQK